MAVFSTQHLVDCYANYIQQVGLIESNSQSIFSGTFQVGLADRVREVCAHYPSLTQKWVDEFLRIFSVATNASSAAGGQSTQNISHDWLWEEEGEAVFASDRIVWDTLAYCLRHTVRTNYNVPSAQALVIKIMHPHRDVREIFMDHPDMQGVLLKGAMVARGGLRWSDRPDFRTECWQLMETQILKNTMIVPSGAKGAFVRKNTSVTPLEIYRIFVQGVLDISDNWVDGRVVSAQGVRCYDGEDYYNVVAADKGTATFSDEGNALAEQRGYWMGDAFASGGSKGYNHKKLAITSRGVWASVRHHLQCAAQGLAGEVKSIARPLRMVGVGDMAGDVFGNGLLEDPNVVLLAAFNHEAIFLDPQPDPGTSYAQRRVLFDTEGSRWSDYKGFSSGGGVFSRSLVSLPLSPEAAAMLGLSEGNYSPDAVIRAMLTMSVDILWLGGIGTYIKGSDETSVPDKDNDRVRVNGKDIKAAIIAEGANLGVTAAGRVECALQGVRINTDSVDNCAGVHCSDREVNIKILLGQALKTGEIDDVDRLAMLTSMTQDVCSLVLRENAWQNMALTLAQESHDDHSMVNVLRALSVYAQAGCAQDVAVLQDNLLQTQRAGRTHLTRPELAWVLALAKRAVKNTILRQDDAVLYENQAEVMAYFPSAIQERFAPLVAKHMLARDIRATACVNRWIDMTGPVAVGLWASAWGVSLQQVILAWCRVDKESAGWSLKQTLDADLVGGTAINDVLNALRTYQSTLRSALQEEMCREQTTNGDGDQAFSHMRIA